MNNNTIGLIFLCVAMLLLISAIAFDILWLVIPAIILWLMTCSIRIDIIDKEKHEELRNQTKGENK